MTTLPQGYSVRLRPEIRYMDRGRVLLGGSPLRAVTLSERAVGLMNGDTVVVRCEQGDRLAQHLLRGNLADPHQLGDPVPAADITVVVPVRDRAEQLDRCLAALRGLAAVVVDDASSDPARTVEVATRHGARVVRLASNQGPAAARNAGLRHVATPYVAFVDSDVTVSTAALLGLSRHLGDPRLAVIGPLVRARRQGSRVRWFERYEEVAGSLALGRRACEVRPGAAVAWLPSACLLARRSLLGDGFADDMRVGEDVDLVWRLASQGRIVRYEPAVVAQHDARASMGGWLARKFVYGTGGADLAARHGNLVAPAVLSPLGALAGATILMRSRWLFPVAMVAALWGARAVSCTLPPVPGRSRQSLRLAGQGLGWAVRQESALVLRHWWPASLLAALVNRTARRVVVTSVLIDSVVALREHGGPLVPLLVGRRLDDAAYGAGLWWGAVRRRDWRCLAVRWVGRS